MNTVRWLIRCFLGLSVLTLLACALLRQHAALVTPAVWVRGTIVVGSALVLTALAARSARGSARAFLRLRIISAVVATALVVIAALPGVFPVWFRVEQAVCGLLLLSVVFLVNGRRLRSTLCEPAGVSS